MTSSAESQSPELDWPPQKVHQVFSTGALGVETSSGSGRDLKSPILLLNSEGEEEEVVENGQSRTAGLTGKEKLFKKGQGGGIGGGVEAKGTFSEMSIPHQTVKESGRDIPMDRDKYALSEITDDGFILTKGHNQQTGSDEDEPEPQSKQNTPQNQPTVSPDHSTVSPDHSTASLAHSTVPPSPQFSTTVNNTQQHKKDYPHHNDSRRSTASSITTPSIPNTNSLERTTLGLKRDSIGVHHDSSRRSTGMSITPLSGNSGDGGFGLSSSESETSLSKFSRGSSYILRKKGKKKKVVTTLPRQRESLPMQPMGASDSGPSIYSSPRTSLSQFSSRHSMTITPRDSLDRSMSGAGMFSSSSEESLAGIFNRDKTHNSFVLRPKKKVTSRPIPEQTVISNPAAQLNPVEPIIIETPTQSPPGDPEGGEEEEMPFSPREQHNTEEEEVEEEVEEEEEEEAQLDSVPDKIRQRTKRALKALNHSDFEKLCDSNDDPQTTSSFDLSRCFPCLQTTQEPPTPKTLNTISHLGFKMAPFFFFPALPKVLEDIWVGLELLFTLFEFSFVCITFSTEPLNILALVLTLISLLLACFDGFLHFVEGGSCVACFKWGRKKLKKRQLKKNNQDIEKCDGNKQKKETSFTCKFIPEKVREWIRVGSELVRIIVTELLLYPLAILDILELVESETYHVDTGESKINFSLFVIGFFYLALTVYFLRLLMALSAIVSISSLPKTTGQKYSGLLKKFALHLTGQILVSMAILVMVSTKVSSEKCYDDNMFLSSGSGSGMGATGAISSSGSGSDSGVTESVMSSAISEHSMSLRNETETNDHEASINFSPFLIMTIFTGGIIPFLGVIMFFVVNFHLLKIFSMGFCVDVLSTIVAEDFADTAFKGKGLKHAKNTAKQASEKINHVIAQEQISSYANLFTLKKKMGYRLLNPLVVIFSVLYFALIVAFLVCHALGWREACDSDSGVEFLHYGDHNGAFATFLLGVIIFTVANYQIITVSVIWLLALSGLIVLVIFFPIIVMLTAPFIIAVSLVVLFV